MNKDELNKLQKLWLARVEAFNKSGLTQAEFCRRNNYKIRQFNYWFRKYKESNISENNNTKWVSVNVKEPANSSLKVNIGNANIEISQGFNKKLFTEVVEILSELC